MNILLINQPIGNRGDESAHRSLMKSLNRLFPNANITVLFFIRSMDQILPIMEINTTNKYINVTRKHNFKILNFIQFAVKLNITKIIAYLHPIMRELIPYYKKADIVICAPGGICLGGFQNWNHLFMLLLAKDFKKKLVYYSRSFGPFPDKTVNNRIFKKRSLTMLHYFDFLSIRDIETKKLADELNIKYISSIDTAFLDVPQTAIPKEIIKEIGTSNYIVFVPNSLTWHYFFKNIPQDVIDSFYIEIIKRCRKIYPDSKIVMLPQLFYAGNNSDYQYFLKIKKQSEIDNMYVVNDTFSSNIQQSIIQNSKCIIGARYHSIVFAINNNVPFIALGYEHKINGLLESLNKSDRMVDITNIFVDSTKTDKIICQIEKLLNTLKKDSLAQAKAHTIANDCLTKLYFRYKDIYNV